jgi:hypothetical protein
VVKDITLGWEPTSSLAFSEDKEMILTVSLALEA